MLVGGSPFAASLTKYPTTRAEVAFPTASPDKPAWVAEAGTIPEIGLNDDADIVAVKKLAEILKMSNESISDATVNLTAQVADLLRDSSGPELDRGLLYGTAATEPKGVVPNVLAVDATDLSGAITAAIGAIGDAGGTATHIAGKPSLFAHERNIKATGSGVFLYPLGRRAAVRPDRSGRAGAGRLPGLRLVAAVPDRPDHRLRGRHEPRLLL